MGGNRKFTSGGGSGGWWGNEEYKIRKKMEQVNRLNSKMYYKSVIIHKNKIFLYFQNKVKNLHKDNNNDNNKVIPFQIIQYFWMLTPLPQNLATLSPPTGNAKMTNSWKRQPSTPHGSKATETLLVWLSQKIKFKRCLSICWWRCGELVWPGGK